jgi:hypothetical protein
MRHEDRILYHIRQAKGLIEQALANLGTATDLTFSQTELSKSLRGTALLLDERWEDLDSIEDGIAEGIYE